MKKIFLIATLVSFAMISTTVPSYADSEQGQKIFKKKFRKACRFSGVRFAQHHTQGEWEEFYESGKFPEEAKKICPALNLDKINNAWWPHIYDFSMEYAKDSSHLPKC